MSSDTLDRLKAKIAERTSQLAEAEEKERAREAERSRSDQVRRTQMIGSAPPARASVTDEERRAQRLLRRTKARQALLEFLSTIKQIEHVKITMRGAQVRKDSWEVIPFHELDWSPSNELNAWIEVRHGVTLLVHEDIEVQALHKDCEGIGVTITSLVGPGCDRPRKFRGTPSLLQYLNGPLSETIVDAVSHVSAHKEVLRKEIDQILSTQRQRSTVNRR